MQNRHHVYFFMDHLFLLPEGNKDVSIKPYQLISSNTRLIAEEIHALLKEETQKHFLHVSDFNLYFISEKLLTIPTTVFDNQLVNEYWQRMYEKLSKETQLQVFISKHYKVNIIYEVHDGWTAFIGNHFNLKTSPVYVEELLNPPSHEALDLQLMILPKHFWMVLKSQNVLLFLDTCFYDTVDDILYFVLNVYKKRNTNLDLKTLHLHSFCGRIITESFLNDFTKIQDFTNVEITEQIKSYP